jgi:SAM-dependent methyltransferase
MKYQILSKILKGIKDPKSALVFLLLKIGIFNKVIYLVDYIYDHSKNIETSILVGESDLDSIDGLSQAHANKYAPTPVFMLWMLTGIFKKYKSYHFIDIGCGKGRACFYATKIFRRVSGIDFSPKLINEANQNLKNINMSSKQEIELKLADARRYVLPNENCVIYLGNPFDNHILKEFLSLNKSHFKNYKSIIIYIYPEWADTLISFGFIQLFTIQRIQGYSFQ